MIYFLEHDLNGNIVHVVCDPYATIVPLINRVKVVNEDGSLEPLAEPVGIDQATHDLLITNDPRTYIFDASTETVVKKAASNG